MVEVTTVLVKEVPWVVDVCFTQKRRMLCVPEPIDTCGESLGVRTGRGCLSGTRRKGVSGTKDRCDRRSVHGKKIT